MTKSLKQLPYRRGVGVMLINSGGAVFTGKRIDAMGGGHEAWQMPQGGMDKGEEPRETAFRELEEETGIAPQFADVLAESQNWLTYDLPADVQGKIWKGKYRGQKQKWFLMRFSGGDRDVNIATAHPEFCDWRWTDPAELPGQIIPFKRPLYAAVIEEFLPLIKRSSL